MAEEGGALELYDKIKSSNSNEFIPEAIPTTMHLPIRNSMAFFVVEPGISFHAVQEVTGDRPRLSLQGWYHAKDPPSKIQNATLHRLKEKGSRDMESEPFEAYQSPLTAVGVTEKSHFNSISDSDREYLSNYIQSTYLQPNSIQEIKKRFEDESSIQLRGFLVEKWVKKLSEELGRESGEDNDLIYTPDYFRCGIKDGWTLTGPPHKQRYLQYCGDTSNSEPSSIGEILATLKKALLESQPFRRYIAVLTSLGEPTGFQGRIRRFRRGLDYTVAHHGLLMDQSVLDATLCFVAGAGKDVQSEIERDSNQISDADIQWQSGDYGGFECYIAADEEEEAAPADEYNEEDDTELLSVSASNNTLNLVYRDEGTMRFVKYVGSKAPSSRYDIAMVYEVEQDHDTD